MESIITHMTTARDECIQYFHQATNTTTFGFDVLTRAPRCCVRHPLPPPAETTPPPHHQHVMRMSIGLLAGVAVCVPGFASNKKNGKISVGPRAKRNCPELRFNRSTSSKFITRIHTSILKELEPKSGVHHDRTVALRHHRKKAYD
jgi:hypothetical protein